MRRVKTWSTPAASETLRRIPCAVCGGHAFAPALSCDGGDPPQGFSYVRCRACGLVQINPQPTPEDIAARYGSKHGEDYLGYEIANEAPFLRLQELALADSGFFSLYPLQAPPPASPPPADAASSAPRAVLDVGCATGALLEKLRGLGWTCTGVEISPSGQYARQRRGLDVRSLPLEQCRFPAASFDVVLASHLIEHLNAPAAFLAEAFRVLKPGGRIFVTTPNISGFQARLFGSRWRSAIFDHLYLFSAVTLTRLLEQSGFTREKIVTWGGLAAGIGPRPLKTILDRAVKHLGSGDVMLIRAFKPGPNGL